MMVSNPTFRLAADAQTDLNRATRGTDSYTQRLLMMIQCKPGDPLMESFQSFQ
jgi:hypothetical protein